MERERDPSHLTSLLFLIKIIFMKETNKEQVKYALKTFLSSLSAALKANAINTAFVNELKEKGVRLMLDIDADKVSLKKATDQLNNWIEKFNRFMKSDLHTRYPLFISAPEYFQVKSNIISFEFFLTQKVQSHEMSLEQEEPIFDECCLLWKKVGLHLSSQEGMMVLSKLIQKANAYIPQEKFPLPDDTQY